jgi:hypothetical protein
MKDTFPEQTSVDVEPIPAQLPRFWQRPAVAYAFASSVAGALLIPFPAAFSWLSVGLVELWNNSGIVFPALAVVLCYAFYCCALLAQGKLNSLHIDRLQLAEYFAYSAGLLGIVFRLESLSRGTTGGFDPKAVMGALAPFKMGLLVWVFVSSIRWLGEHITTIRSSRLIHED